MADGYDRYGQEGGDGGSFVMGLLTGTVLGAGLGMLFAPKAGSELRGQLSEQAGNLANSASEGYKKASEAASEGYKKASEAASEGYKKASDAATEWAGKGREAGRDIYDRTKDAVNRGTEEAQRYVREATGPSSGSPMPSTAGSSTSFSSENIRSSAHEETRGSQLGGTPSGSTGPGGSRRS
jgi:gas vesicle protein